MCRDVYGNGPDDRGRWWFFALKLRASYRGGEIGFTWKVVIDARGLNAYFGREITKVQPAVAMRLRNPSGDCQDSLARVCAHFTASLSIFPSVTAKTLIRDPKSAPNAFVGRRTVSRLVVLLIS